MTMDDANMMSLMGVIGMILIMLVSFIYYEVNWQGNAYLTLLAVALNLFSLIWFISLFLCIFKPIAEVLR